MNKTELIQQLAATCDITQKQANQFCDSFIDILTATLQQGEKITLPGFITCGVKKRPARTGRNPQTGQPLTIPAKKVAYFSAGNKLKEVINKTK